jgi:Arc/MetJ-type ribon-helix-helix transcriptional regulator
MKEEYISVRIDTRLRIFLDDLVSRNFGSISDIVRKAIEEYYISKDGKFLPSAEELKKFKEWFDEQNKN